MQIAWGENCSKIGHLVLNLGPEKNEIKSANLFNNGTKTRVDKKGRFLSMHKFRTFLHAQICSVKEVCIHQDF